MQQQFQTLLRTRMNRKDFLKHVLFGFVAMTGATAFIKSFGSSAALGRHQASSVRPSDYGSGAYGGATRRQV